MAPAGLRIRKLAGDDGAARVKRYDPETGQPYLADPEAWVRDDPATWVSKPWPLVGIQIEGDAPKLTTASMQFVQRAVAEGWITLENPRVVHRPAGPREQPWGGLGGTHTFHHADAVVIHTVDGDVRYRVVDNPDKWPEEKVDDPTYPDGLGFGGDVRWFFVLKLEKARG